MQNTIWDINNDDGMTLSSEMDIKEHAYNFFKSQYKIPEAEDMWNWIQIIKDVPRMFSNAESDEIRAPITIKELESTIKNLPKEKSPGLNGWTQELFLSFFDLLGKDLLLAVEESRIKGFIPGILNATFFTLIPKVSKPITFNDFRPIALCNFVYKAIARVIAN
jgi:hypothetical protein